MALRHTQDACYRRVAFLQELERQCQEMLKHVQISSLRNSLNVEACAPVMSMATPPSSSSIFMTNESVAQPGTPHQTPSDEDLPSRNGSSIDLGKMS